MLVWWLVLMNSDDLFIVFKIRKLPMLLASIVTWTLTIAGNGEGQGREGMFVVAPLILLSLRCYGERAMSMLIDWFFQLISKESQSKLSTVGKNQPIFESLG